MEHVEAIEEKACCQRQPSSTTKWAALIVIACLAVCGWRLIGPKSALAGAGWNEDWDSAIHQAKASGKPALVLFTADWCPACQKFESQTLTDPEVQKLVNEKYTTAVVDLSDRNATAAQRAQDFNVKAIPMLILYDANGKEQARAIGMSAQGLVLWLKSGGTQMASISAN